MYKKRIKELINNNLPKLQQGTFKRLTVFWNSPMEINIPEKCLLGLNITCESLKSAVKTADAIIDNCMIIEFHFALVVLIFEKEYIAPGKYILTCIVRKNGNTADTVIEKLNKQVNENF